MLLSAVLWMLSAILKNISGHGILRGNLMISPCPGSGKGTKELSETKDREKKEVQVYEKER